MKFRLLAGLLLVATFTGLILGAPRTQADPVGRAVAVAQVNQGPGYAEHPLIRWETSVQPAFAGPGLTNPTPAATSLKPSTFQKFLGLAGDGRGKTVVIVDAFHNPTVAADLDVFNATFGLPPRCGLPTAGGFSRNRSEPTCFNFSVVFADGVQPAYDFGWALEIALDVQWVHAVAPFANVVLIEATTNSYTNLFHAVDIGSTRGQVISNSWGSVEFAGQVNYDNRCATVLCVFSSGDNGNPPGWPATNPHVLAVGGTTLVLNPVTGQRISEKAWSGSGGGLSTIEPKPAFQNGVNPNSKRGVPDVSTVADPATGAAIFFSYAGVGWYQVGGTSLSAPIWAGIIAVVDQQSLTPLTANNFGPRIYGAANRLYDVTQGTNGACGAVCTAGPGYDYVTGLGAATGGIDRALWSLPFSIFP